jgi:hypothetical protein
MGTKKLLLGLCVLAAVTGAAPQVFGTLQSELEPLKPAITAEQQACAELGQGPALTAERNGVPNLLSMDDKRQMALTEIVDLTREKLETETKGLKEMGEQELCCIENALGVELHDYFINEICVSDIEEANAKVNAIESSIAESRSSVSAAEERHKEGRLSGFGLFLAKRWSAVKVWALNLKRKKAEEHLARMRLQHSDSVVELLNLRAAARRFKSGACELRTQRIECLRGLNEAWIRRRVVSQKSDIEKLENHDGINVSTIELEDMRGRGIQDTNFLLEEASRYKNEERITARIANAFAHQHRRDWRRYAVKGRLDSCRKLKDSFHPNMFDYAYDSSMAPFDEQRRLLRSDAAVGEADKLLRLAEDALMQTREIS